MSMEKLRTDGVRIVRYLLAWVAGRRTCHEFFIFIRAVHRSVFQAIYSKSSRELLLTSMNKTSSICYRFQQRNKNAYVFCCRCGHRLSRRSAFQDTCLPAVGHADSQNVAWGKSNGLTSRFVFCGSLSIFVLFQGNETNSPGAAGGWRWSSWRIPPEHAPLLIGLCCGIALILLALSAVILWRCCLLPTRKKDYCKLLPIEMYLLGIICLNQRLTA